MSMASRSGTTAIPQPIDYAPNAKSQIGDTSTFFTLATIDNYRIWNVARDESGIREGMSRQYDDDPRIVLDYRFEGHRDDHRS